MVCVQWEKEGRKQRNDVGRGGEEGEGMEEEGGGGGGGRRGERRAVCKQRCICLSSTCSLNTLEHPLKQCDYSQLVCLLNQLLCVGSRPAVRWPSRRGRAWHR